MAAQLEERAFQPGARDKRRFASRPAGRSAHALDANGAELTEKMQTDNEHTKFFRGQHVGRGEGAVAVFAPFVFERLQ